MGAIAYYLWKTKFRGGPEIRPVAAAGAACSPSGGWDSVSLASDVGLIIEPELNKLRFDELKHVHELTISRPGVAMVTFHGETDCTDLDFEQIIKLEIGEVLVYPHEKPPVGVGLNKAATVIMYECWPPNGRALLQNVRSQERYKKKIKHMTEQKQATFIDYDCNTGIWKFSVKHF